MHASSDSPRYVDYVCTLLLTYLVYTRFNKTRIYRYSHKAGARPHHRCDRIAIRAIFVAVTYAALITDLLDETYQESRL